MKACPKCKIDKPHGDFYKDKNKKDGLHYNCKDCENIKTKNKQDRYKNLNSKKDFKTLGEIYYKTCFKCQETKLGKNFPKNFSSKDGFRTICKECNIWERIKYNYDLSKEDFYRKLKEQHNQCMICKKQFSKQPNDRLYPCVDHKKGTKKVRGLLCHNCNVGIGLFYESIPILKNTIKYLDHWNMNDQRYRDLQWGYAKLTQEEIEEGWHFCADMDDLLCLYDSDDCFCKG